MRLRSPRVDEAEAVLEVIVARDVADIGRPDYTLRGPAQRLARAGIDLARDVFVVEDDDGRLLGWADVEQRRARVTGRIPSTTGAASARCCATPSRRACASVARR